MSHTADDLRALQAKTLEEKIQISTARIIEWYETWNGQVYVSFSGGKDSTVLLDLVRRVYPDVPAVFSDTGLEFPELREFVKSFDNVEWVKPKQTFVDVLKNNGYPIISKTVSRMVHDVQTLGYGNCFATKTFDGTESAFYDYRRWKFLISAPFRISNKCCDIMKKSLLHNFENQSHLHPFIGTQTYESKQRKK